MHSAVPHPLQTPGKPAHPTPAACPPCSPLAGFSAARPQPWRLPVAGHTLSGWALGEPGGEPWLVLHGGPGSTAQPGLLAPFSAFSQWAWAPQQRGSGPLATRRAGRWHVDTLVADLEALRQALGLAQWSVLGGSWGALLALAYVRQHPQAVRRVVLRGAFTGAGTDVWRLLHTLGATLRHPSPPHSTHPSTHTSTHTSAHALATGPRAPRNRLHMPAWLARVQRVLRNATGATPRAGAATTPLAPSLTRAWLLAEQRLATQGARAALRHSGACPPAQRVALRRTWAQLNHGLRQAQAQHRLQRPPTPAQHRKVALQARVLGRQCCRALHGAWPHWQAWLASAAPTPASAPRLTLVHGQFDAVCAPDNTRWLAGLGRRGASGTPVQTLWTHSGHLAHEPALHTTLRAAVAVAANAVAPARTPASP